VHKLVARAQPPHLFSTKLSTTNEFPLIRNALLKGLKMAVLTPLGIGFEFGKLPIIDLRNYLRATARLFNATCVKKKLCYYSCEVEESKILGSFDGGWL